MRTRANPPPLSQGDNGKSVYFFQPLVSGATASRAAGSVGCDAGKFGSADCAVLARIAWRYECAIGISGGLVDSRPVPAGVGVDDDVLPARKYRGRARDMDVERGGELEAHDPAEFMVDGVERYG